MVRVKKKKNADIKSKLNLTITGLILVLCIFIVYFMPRAKYQGKAITAQILESIPESGQRWQGGEILDTGGDLEGNIYNFISRIFARQYINSADANQDVLFIVLDAGNFHYPKVCFQGAGFTAEELPQRELSLAPGKIKVQLLLNKKKDEQLLSIYWICIDKKIVSSWAEQKAKQLYYSFFNKERVGLMIRMDIPVSGSIDNSINIAEDFLNDIYKNIPEQYKNYIFSEF